MGFVGGALSALLSAGVFFADQELKQASEEKRLPGQGEKTNARLSFSNHHNYGAALNFLEKRPLIVRSLALSMTVFCTVLFLFTFGKKGAGLLKAALALLLGGAYSNLYDRLKQEYVIDYIALRLPGEGINLAGRGKITELIFNIADLGVAIGAMLLAFT